MLVTIPSVVSTSPALSLSLTSQAAGPSDLVSTRQTSVALQAPLSTLQTNADNISATGTPSGSSSAFIAQLLGQDDSIVISDSFEPAPVYNMLVANGLVKYRPSDAGLPPPSSQNTPALSEQENVNVEASAPAATPLNNGNAYEANVPAQQSAVTQALQTLQLQDQDTAAVVATVAVAQRTAPAGVPQNDNKTAPRATNDYKAYQTTQSRNQNLSTPEPRLVVAG